MSSTELKTAGNGAGLEKTSGKSHSGLADVAIEAPRESRRKHKFDDSAGQPDPVDSDQSRRKSRSAAFSLRPGAPFRKDIGRIVRRQLDKALRDLCRLGATADEAIHNVRKRFKRVRAVLRLVRGELGQRIYNEENGALRDAAAAFSEVRNARVLVDAVEKLRHRASDIPPSAFDALERFLKARQRDIHDRLARNVEAMDQLRKAIERGRGRTADWPLPRDGSRMVRRGLRRTCKAGARALEDVEKERTSEHLHECRKQAKYLYHQVQLLERVAPPSVIGLAEQLHELEQKLGDDHDLGMLRAEVAACIAGGLPDVNERLIALIDDWREELQDDCLRQAQKIFRDDSATLRHRFRDCAKQLSPKNG